MTNRMIFLKHGFVHENAPGFNALGRFVPQLARITIKFCKESPHSFGVRQFIEHDVVSFAKENPHVAVYLKPRRNRTPVVVAEYLNGERHWHSMKEFPHSEVRGWMDLYRTASGREFQAQTKHHFTDNPSIQGMWHSYVNTDPKVALATFPSDELTACNAPKSATEKLQELYEIQKQYEKSDKDAPIVPDEVKSQQ